MKVNSILRKEEQKRKRTMVIFHGDVFICYIFSLWESHCGTEEMHSIWNQVDMRSNLSFSTDFESYRISLRQLIHLSIWFL